MYSRLIVELGVYMEQRDVLDPWSSDVGYTCMRASQYATCLLVCGPKAVLGSDFIDFIIGRRTPSDQPDVTRYRKRPMI